jgi:hypothetical protein
MSVSKLKSFSIWAKLNLDVLINIKAESLEDAVEKSKELKNWILLILRESLMMVILK